MSERVRNRGQQRPLRSAGNSSVSGERDANGTKRGGPFETSFRGAHDHQQLFVATVRAIERARGRHGDDRGHDDAGSKLQTKHGAGLVIKRSGLQRRFVWDAHRGDDAVGGRKFYLEFRDLHRARHGAQSQYGGSNGDSASRSYEDSASNDGHPARG